MVSFTSLSVLNTARINGRNLNRGYSVFTNMHSIVCWSVLDSDNIFSNTYSNPNPCTTLVVKGIVKTIWYKLLWFIFVCPSNIFNENDIVFFLIFWTIWYSTSKTAKLEWRKQANYNIVIDLDLN